MQVNSLRLRAQAVGPLPILQHFLDTLQLREILAQSRPLRAYVPALELLVKSLLVEPNALYRVRPWSQQYDPRWIGPGTIGDDAIGRALDRLFEADRASLLTHLALSALEHFDLDTSRIHNDSTSIKLSGAYAHQLPGAIQLRRGFSKDHRPDLKQLVYSLCVTSDGAVPIHYKAYDGNQTDDATHWETWQALCRLLGKNDFIYVADSKLCVRETLLRIDGQQGRFVTILPRTRSEVGAFADDCLANRIRWAPLWRQRCPRHQGRWEIFELAQGFFQMQEGFGLHWYRSSEKRRRDHEDREEQIAAALERLERLNNPQRRGRKDAPSLQKAADQVLAKLPRPRLDPGANPPPGNGAVPAEPPRASDPAHPLPPGRQTNLQSPGATQPGRHRPRPSDGWHLSSDHQHPTDAAPSAAGLQIPTALGKTPQPLQIPVGGLPSVRIPMKADTCSNPCRTPFRSCRTVAGAKRRSLSLINGCPTGVKISPSVLHSFGAPSRGDALTIHPKTSSRRLFGRAVSGGNELANSSSRCRRSLRVTDSPARPNRRALD